MGDLIGKDDVWTSDVGKIRADLAAAQQERDALRREVEAYRSAYEQAIFEWRDYGYEDCKNDNQTVDWIEYRVRELLAQEGGKPRVDVGTLGHIDHSKTALTAALTKVGAQPQYREPTLEDAWQLKSIQAFPALEMQYALKQLGFVRKVQP